MSISKAQWVDFSFDRSDEIGRISGWFLSGNRVSMMEAMSEGNNGDQEDKSLNLFSWAS